LSMWPIYLLVANIKPLLSSYIAPISCDELCENVACRI